MLYNCKQSISAHARRQVSYNVDSGWQGPVRIILTRSPKIMTNELLSRIPASTLINGRGRYSGGPQSELSVITVEPGKRCVRFSVFTFVRHPNDTMARYRFRLINMACTPNFVFSIDGHSFTIIEVDGVTHQPVVADSLRIFVGPYCDLAGYPHCDTDISWF